MMDIVTGCSYPASKLSNFEHYAFEIDDIPCNSMEGFLQSLKFQDPEKQKEVCLLVGKKAKFKGKKKKWWVPQKLYWMGIEYDRHSEDYQALIEKAYQCLARNQNFVKVLLDTGESVITHSEGKKDPFKTILTEDEFCSILMKTREKLKKERMK